MSQYGRQTLLQSRHRQPVAQKFDAVTRGKSADRRCSKGLILTEYHATERLRSLLILHHPTCEPCNY